MFSKDTLNRASDTLSPLEYFKKWGVYPIGGGEDSFTQEQVDTKVADAITAHVKNASTVGWKEGLPDEIKADPLWAKYETQNDAHKGLIDAQKFLGREKLPVPLGPDDSEAYKLILDKLGAPDKVEGYTTPTDMQFEEGFPKVDEALITSVKEAALKTGVLPKQFDSIYRAFMEHSNLQYKAAMAKVVEDKQNAESALRKELGADYPKMEALVGKVITQFADQAAIDSLNKGIGNDPGLLKMMASIGKVLSEHSLVGDAPDLNMTPDQIQSELNTMQANMDGPLYKKEHPQHQEFVDKKDRLTRLLLNLQK